MQSRRTLEAVTLRGGRRVGFLMAGCFVVGLTPSPGPFQQVPEAAPLIAELSKDSRAQSLSAEQRELALKEAEGAFGYCLTNVSLKNLLECSCYARTFFNARLDAGFETMNYGMSEAEREKFIAALMRTHGISREEAEKSQGAQRMVDLKVTTASILHDILSGRTSVRACAAPEKIKNYVANHIGRVVLQTFRGTEDEKKAFLDCAQKLVVERFMAKPIPEIALVDAAATNAFTSCPRTKPSAVTAPAGTGTVRPESAAKPAVANERPAAGPQVEDAKKPPPVAEMTQRTGASAPAMPAPSAQTGDAGPPSTEPRAAPSRPAAAGRGIAGCWVYNTINLTIFDEGRVTGFLDRGKWSPIGENRFLITWPPSIDTLALSTDGSALSGSNNYAGPIASAQRISGDPSSVVGTWKWPNGSTTALSAGGEAQNGPVSGKWTQLRGNSIRIAWNFYFTDDVTLSADGQNLAGKNMLGTPVGGRRTPCSK